MKKCRFPEVALTHFNEMPVERLTNEIKRSSEAILGRIPRNHKEELLLVGNQKRMEVLKVILQYKNQPVLRSKVEEIAVLVQ